MGRLPHFVVPLAILAKRAHDAGRGAGGNNSRQTTRDKSPIKSLPLSTGRRPSSVALPLSLNSAVGRISMCMAYEGWLTSRSVSRDRHG